MIKLMPNETVRCEWSGITITTSRILIQQSTGKDDFSLRQFPAEDYRRIEASFVRSRFSKIVGVFLLFVGLMATGAMFVPNPHSKTQVELLPKKGEVTVKAALPIPTPTIFEMNPKILELEKKREELAKPGFKFFKGTRQQSIENQISVARAEAERKIAELQSRVAQENERIQQENEREQQRLRSENERIDQENQRRLSMKESQIREVENIRWKVVAGGAASILAALFFFGLYSRSGNIRVRFEFNKSKDPVDIERPLGKKHLPEALNFVTEVDNVLSPVKAKLNKRAA